MVFYWECVAEEHIDSLRDNILTSVGIRTSYNGKVTVWQARTGVFFGKQPVYLVISPFGDNKDNLVRADLYYLGEPNIELSSARRGQQDKFINENFKRILKKLSITKEIFFDSLEGVCSTEPEKTAVRGLANLL